MSGKKKRRAPIIVLILLFIIIALIVWSFIGRIAPDSVLPDSFDLYASAPNPVHLAGQVLGHESLPDIMALAELEPLMPMFSQVKNSGLADNKWVRYAARGRLDAVFLPGKRILAAWDAGLMSPLLRVLPLLAGRITVPGLYYVQAGKYSRFEYRQADGMVFFIGPYKNLLVISNNSGLYESVIAGSSRDGDRFGSEAKKFHSRNHDIAFLLSPAMLMNTLGGGGTDTGGINSGEIASGGINSALNHLQFPGPIEASLSILPSQLKLRLITPLGTGNQALQKIIERNSQGTPLLAMIPQNAQYLTLLSAYSLKELLNAASAAAAGTAAGAEWENNLKKADSSARMTLGMNLEELLFSWTGSQFAVYGLEGRPNPVIALEIRDENKRKEVFNKAFKSIFLNENIQLNLDGNRIPRIQVPGFLNSFLLFLGVNVPSPYYTIQNNYLFLSESAETLLAAVNAVRRNEVLPKTGLWRTISEDNSGPSSFSLFYSLDRSLPFFLRGNSAATAVLRLYRQGLARLHLENRVLNISFQVIPGERKGMVPVSGYPIDLTDSGSARQRAGSSLYRISSGRDTRLILSRGGDALALNPLDRTIREFTLSSPGAGIQVIPAIPGTGEEAAWVVNSHGHVSLVNRDMESLKGFPLSTGISLSAPPGAWGGKLFLCNEDGSVHTVDSRASVNRWGRTFSAALRTAPSFLDFKDKSYAAIYPKSFFGEIFLLDAGGMPLPHWPAPVSGIAFGSPLIFSFQDRLLVAFITQAGELAVYTETAEILPGFPIQLEGVFYLQPVFDGEKLWIIESDGTLYSISLGAEVLSHRIPGLSVKENGYITAVNMGGGKPDASSGAILITGEGNALHGYTGSFNSLEGFPLPVWGRPVFGDLNADGKNELAGIGMDNKLYMWQFRQNQRN